MAPERLVLPLCLREEKAGRNDYSTLPEEAAALDSLLLVWAYYVFAHSQG